MRRPPMFRALLPCLLLIAPLVQAEPRFEGRQVSVGAADAQQFMQGQFPQRHSALGGLLQLVVSAPRLELPPGERLHLGLDLAAAPAGAAPSAVGRVQLSSALRYDTTAQAFFLEQPVIEDFRPARPGLELDAGTRSLLSAWLADYARSEPVYRVEPAMAALLGGVQMQAAGVRDGRLYVRFDRDPTTGMAAP